jgi:prophage regulatory protein
MPKASNATPPASPELEARYYSVTELAAFYGVHRNTPWRWARKGLLPKPVQLSKGCTRWWGPAINEHRAQLETEGLIEEARTTGRSIDALYAERRAG